MLQQIPTKEDTYEWVEENKRLHLRLTLPTTFDEYWNNVDKDIRTQYRKAQKLGYTSKWTTEVAGTDISEIWDSWEEKQDRPLNRIMHHFNPNMGDWTNQGCWPYSYYPHTQGYLDLIQVYDDDGIVVAYLEIASTTTDTVVFSTMAHAYHQKNGIMKLLFMDTIKGLIDRHIKYFYYLKPRYVNENPEKAIFVRDLRFEEVQ